MSDSIGTTRKHREYDALLERYQQLEKVANEMIDYIVYLNYIRGYKSFDEMSNAAFKTRSFRKKLEALGVILDG